jgi:hypothetical protein
MIFSSAVLGGLASAVGGAGAAEIAAAAGIAALGAKSEQNQSMTVIPGGQTQGKPKKENHLSGLLSQDVSMKGGY